MTSMIPIVVSILNNFLYIYMKLNTSKTPLLLRFKLSSLNLMKFTLYQNIICTVRRKWYQKAGFYHESIQLMDIEPRDTIPHILWKTLVECLFMISTMIDITSFQSLARVRYRRLYDIRTTASINRSTRTGTISNTRVRARIRAYMPTASLVQAPSAATEFIPNTWYMNTTLCGIAHYPYPQRVNGRLLHAYDEHNHGYDNEREVPQKI